MSNGEKLKKRAAEFEQKRQFDKALALYIEVLSVGEAAGEEADVALHNRVGDLMFRLGNVPDALSYYEKAADLYAERGFLNNAIALCNKILRQSPGRSSIYYKLGRISASKGFKSDAKKNFLEYADRMRAAGNPDEAFRALKEFADLCPDQDDVRLMLADQLSRENRPGEALEQLQALHAKLEAEGRVVEARATIDRMRALDPTIDPRRSSDAPSTPDGGLVFLDISYDEPVARGDAIVPASRIAPPVPVVAGVEPVAAALADSFESLLGLADEEDRLPGGPPQLSAPPPATQLTPTPVVRSVALPVDGHAAAHPAPAADAPLDAALLDGFAPTMLELEACTPSLAPGETLGGSLLLDEALLDLQLTASEPDIVGALEPLQLEPLVTDAGGRAAEHYDYLLPDPGVTLLDGLDLGDAGTGELSDPSAEAVGWGSQPFAGLPLLDEMADELSATRPEGRDTFDEEIDDTPLELIWPDEPDESVSASVPVAAVPGLEGADVATFEQPVQWEADEPEQPAMVPVEAISGPGLVAAVRHTPQGGATIEPPPAELLRQRLEYEPDDSVTRRHYAEALLDKGDREAGIAELERAMVGFERAARLGDAFAVADELVRLLPDSVRHHQRRVEFAARSNDRSHLVMAYVELAETLFRAGQPEKASVVFSRAAELSPDDERARAGLALSSVTVASVPTPVSTPATLAEDPPRVSRVTPPVVGATSSSPTPRRIAAMPFLTPAWSLNAVRTPRSATPVRSAVVIVADAPAEESSFGSPSPAAVAPDERVRDTVVSAADDGSDFVDLGDWLRAQEAPRSTRMRTEAPQPTGDESADFDEMLRRFKQGVAENVDEDDSDSHYDLGIAYREMGLVDDAIGEFQKALRGVDGRVRTYEALGQCFLDKRQYAVAATVLARAVESAPGDDHQLVGVLYLSGYAAEAIERWREALGFYQRVFAVDIRFRDVTERLTAMERLTR